jgi:hypothetical protein
MSTGFLSGKTLPRRTFLQGMGASVALPFLDAMVPAGRFANRFTDAATANTPFIAIEEVHGLAGCNAWGATQYLYAPEKVGKNFEMVPANALKNLEPYQDYLTIISNTDCRMAEPFETPEIGGDHFRSSTVFLTQSHPKQTQGSDVYSGVSMDQLYAQKFGQDTPLPSLQLTIEPIDQSGGCSYNYACAYMDTLSWAAADKPLPMIRDPRIVFETMFGAGVTAEDRANRLRTRRSLLDWINGDIASMAKQLEAGDRAKLEQYTTNIREIERRIELTEARNKSGEARDMPEAPAGVPDSFTEHMQVLFDLQVLALTADITRVITLKTGRDASNRAFPEAPYTGSFHPASHYGAQGERVLTYNTLSQWRIGHLPYLLDKMKSTQIAGQSLLDKSMIVWGSPMGDSNLHNHRRCPVFFLGKAGGVLEGNVHLKAPDGTPMANVLLTALHGLGRTDITTFGDSTGEFSLRSGSAATSSSR